MSSVERVVICPKCGEDNPENFKFCGMCGTTLGQTTPLQKVEARRPAGAPVPNLPPVNRPLDAPAFTRAEQPPNVEARRPVGAPVKTLGSVINASATSEVASGTTGAPTISGPSLLGLDRPTSAAGNAERTAALTEPRQSEFGPTPDLLREKSFSGLDSFFEPEEPRGGPGRLILFLVLLAALGAAGWWTYTNYLATTGEKPAAATPASTSSADNSAQTNGSANASQQNSAPQSSSSQSAAPAPDSNQSAPAAGTPAATPGSGSAENASGNSGAAGSAAANPATTGRAAVPSANPPSQPSTAAREEARRRARQEAEEKRQARLEQEHAAKAAAAKNSADAVATGGDADFRKGEAYLYGRGAAQNCDQAVRYLKSAAAQQSAKARSTFGTMYATGHCVARDLPTSYQWFAMALQLDPNNKILQSDLNAIWSQMTPPERQSATRAKQQ